MANITVNRIVVEELFALGALRVVFIAARIANVDVVAVLVDSEGNFVSKEILVALCAQQVFISKTTGANIRAVVYHGHLALVVILLAMLAEAVIFIETAFADVNAFTVAIDNVPRLRAIVLALLTELATIVVTIIAKKLRRNFVGAGNAKSICADLEYLEVVSVVLPDRNFGIEVRVNPIAITTKTTTASDVNVVFVAAVFFSLPEVRNAFQSGNLTLNKVAVKFRFSLSAASTAISVVEPTLKQKPVIRFVHKELPCGLAIVKRFGLVWIGSSEHDKGHVVASIAGASTVVFAIEDVEGVTGNHSRASIVSFGIRHCEKVARVY